MNAPFQRIVTCKIQTLATLHELESCPEEYIQWKSGGGDNHSRQIGDIEPAVPPIWNRGKFVVDAFDRKSRDMSDLGLLSSSTGGQMFCELRLVITVVGEHERALR